MINIKNRGKIKGPVMLFSAALIWGMSFVAQSVGTESVGAFTFNGIRTVIGCVSLLPIIFADIIKRKKRGLSAPVGDRKLLIRGGVSCGLVLFVSSNLQQFAFNYTTVGKIGFLTAMYMIFVPVLGLFLRKRVKPIVWLSIALAVFGMYLLCLDGTFNVNFGDFLTLLCAIGFAVHILIIDHFSQDVDSVRLSCLQFLVSGILSCICMFVFESPDTQAIASVIPELLYAGVMSYSVAFTFQIIGQKYTEPTIASMLLCFESVFSVICGWAVLGEALSLREISGCVIMFGAIILTQIPDRKSVLHTK